MTKPYSSALFALLLLPLVLAVAETVTFPSGEITLHGVLHKPEGTGPFPPVIYNHGSSPGMMSKEAFRALGPVVASHGGVFFGPYSCNAKCKSTNILFSVHSRLSPVTKQHTHSRHRRRDQLFR